MNQWRLVYDSWNAKEQPLREALCTLGNGLFATRGAAEESEAGGPHYPGTYLAGGYNRLKSTVKGREIENEDLVNWPNWLPLNFRPEGGRWLDIQEVRIEEFRQELDLHRGVLERRIRFHDDDGRATLLESRRLVSLSDPHLAAIQWSLTPLNWSGRIEIRSALDGSVKNEGVDRYKALNGKHLEALDLGGAGETIYLLARSNQSHIVMAQAARTRIFAGGGSPDAERGTQEDPETVGQTISFFCREGEPVRVEKVVALYTSRDPAVSEPLLASREAVRQAGSFEELLEAHAREWTNMWFRCDIRLHGTESEQRTLRLNIFHLIQTVSCHSADRDVGVPSRGLHGEAYRGHILWDELFIFPFLNLSIPDLTRGLLMYRYRRLPRARQSAAAAGFRGAMYPWQSGSDGREESQVVHLNPQSGRWIPDNSNLQRHVNHAIAFNVWQYYQATDDHDFMTSAGAEMFLEIARFLADLTTFNQKRGRYEILGVMGPDEYHTRYPGAEKPGLDNNAYTNVMTVWVLAHALEVLEIIAPERRRELSEKMELSDAELERWNDISRKMFLPFHDGGIISQFEGFEKLQELDWEGYGEKYGDIQRLDRILEAEGDTPNRYKAAKQADALMLFYLFSSEELEEIFQRLGYPFSSDLIPRNIEYYSARTSHGSTLSRVVFAWVQARRDRERSWQLFDAALKSDLLDIQGGTTPEGIHLGAMAGTTDLIQGCYLGISLRGDTLWFSPILPSELQGIELRLRYRGHWISAHATQDRLKISFDEGWSRSVRVGVGGMVHTFEQGEKREFSLEDGIAGT